MIGIIGAMEEEIAALKSKIPDALVEERCGMSFVLGKLNGRDVVVVRSGIGKVNAGACAQLLIDRYSVSCLVNTGIAGSLDNAIEIGDIVLSEDAVQYDVDATNFGYPLGEIPRAGTLSFRADERMLDIAASLNREVNPEINTFRGRVCSGDKFVSDSKTKKWIIDHFQGCCCEMEGAAIAQIASQNEVPFLIIRAISDKADHSALVDYPEFEEKAIKHCVKLTEALVAKL